jgi:hypothetical protein
MWDYVMSDVMVLMSESFRRAVRVITIFLESSRLRDYMTRVTNILARIHEALYGGTCIGHIESL